MLNRHYQRQELAAQHNTNAKKNENFRLNTIATMAGDTNHLQTGERAAFARPVEHLKEAPRLSRYAAHLCVYGVTITPLVADLLDVPRRVDFPATGIPNFSLPFHWALRDAEGAPDYLTLEYTTWSSSSSY